MDLPQVADKNNISVPPGLSFNEQSNLALGSVSVPNIFLKATGDVLLVPWKNGTTSNRVSSVAKLQQIERSVQSKVCSPAPCVSLHIGVGTGEPHRPGARCRNSQLPVYCNSFEEVGAPTEAVHCHWAPKLGSSEFPFGFPSTRYEQVAVMP